MTRRALTWPRRHPYNKRYFQTSVGQAMTIKRKIRIKALLAKWDPRLFDAGVNVPECLRVELARLVGLRDGVDWAMFPGWVRKERKGEG